MSPGASGGIRSSLPAKVPAFLPASPLALHGHFLWTRPTGVSMDLAHQEKAGTL